MRSKFLLQPLSLFLTLIFIPLFAKEKIDVSKYPIALQRTYNIVHNKCTNCHSFSKIDYTDSVIPSYWEETVDKMQKMEDSNICICETQDIYEFLVYDTSVRRCKDLKEEMCALPKEKQIKEQASIDKVLNKYKQLIK